MRIRSAVLAFGLASLLLIIAAVAKAEDVIIELDDGTRVEGRILIESPSRLVIKTESGKVTVDVARIRSRKAAPSAKDRYLERRAAIEKSEADDPSAWRALARWCKEQGLLREEREAWEKLQALLPEDAEAKGALSAAAGEAEGGELGAGLRARLDGCQVHFDFARASPVTILRAIGAAAEVSIKIDGGAAKELERKGIRLRYLSEHSALRALQDVTKASGLDFLITNEAVLIASPAGIAQERKKRGLDGGASRRLSGDDAARLMRSSRHTLTITDKPLSSFILYLKQNTPFKVLYRGPEAILERRISFESVEEPLADVLKRILSPLDLGYSLQGEVIFIAPKAEIEATKPDDPDGKDEKAGEKED